MYKKTAIGVRKVVENEIVLPIHASTPHRHLQVSEKYRSVTSGAPCTDMNLQLHELEMALSARHS